MSNASSDLEDDAILDELESLGIEASHVAVQQTLAKGVSVFYKERGVLVREDPDGRRFEVRHTQLKRGAYDVIRELEPAR